MNTPTFNSEKRLRTFIHTCAIEDARNAHKQYLAWSNKKRIRLAGAKHAYFDTKESLEVANAFGRRYSIITGASELYASVNFRKWMRAMATHYTHYWNERFNTDDWVLDLCAQELAQTLETWLDATIEGKPYGPLQVATTPIEQ